MYRRDSAAANGHSDILRRLGAGRIAMVTPYLDDVQAKIIANYQAAGFACMAERHAGLQDNFSFVALPAAEIEARTGIPVIASIARTLWGALQAAGIDAAPLRAAGRIFQMADAL